ncbi:hypothetical protein ACJX0J_041013, partial [Zea mays]
MILAEELVQDEITRSDRKLFISHIRNWHDNTAIYAADAQEHGYLIISETHLDPPTNVAYALIGLETSTLFLEMMTSKFSNILLLNWITIIWFHLMSYTLVSRNIFLDITNITLYLSQK